MSGTTRRVRQWVAFCAWAPMLLLARIASGEPGVDTAPREFARPFHVIAHRGASSVAPENSLPAFERALELGVFEVELDVRRSSDGQLFLFHDAELDEKTDAVGPIEERDAATLRQLDIGSWFDREHPGLERRYAGTRLLSLRELFERFGPRLFYHVEIKGSEVELPRELIALVNEFGLTQSVMLTSFSFDQLVRAREIDARLPSCLLIARGDELASSADAGTPLVELQRREIERARVAGFSQVGIAASEISPEIVALAHAQGLEVRAWGVKSDAHIDRVIDAGANGMTIDWPERLIRRLLERAAEAPRSRTRQRLGEASH